MCQVRTWQYGYLCAVYVAGAVLLLKWACIDLGIKVLEEVPHLNHTHTPLHHALHPHSMPIHPFTGTAASHTKARHTLPWYFHLPRPLHHTPHSHQGNCLAT